MRNRWNIVQVAIAILIGVLIGFVVSWYVTSPSREVIAQWPQPVTVNYGSYDPYTLSVLDGGWDNSHFPARQRFVVFIGRGTEAPGYGYYCDFPFHLYGDRISTIRNLVVTWSNEGVIIQSEDGHQLFIAKAAFIGGR